jgi:hypothetical protein
MAAEGQQLNVVITGGTKGQPGAFGTLKLNRFYSNCLVCEWVRLQQYKARDQPTCQAGTVFDCQTQRAVMPAFPNAHGSELHVTSDEASVNTHV